MENNKLQLLNLFRREPDSTRLLARVVAGGLAVLALWQVLAGLLLPIYVEVPVALVIAAALCAAAIWLTATIVRSADMWEIESAVSARKLMGQERAGSSVSEAAEPVQRRDGTLSLLEQRVAAGDTAFHREYFLQRLQEEVAMARREGHGMSLIAIHVSVPGVDLTPENQSFIDSEVANLASGQHKEFGHVLALGGATYVFSLPKMDRGASRLYLSKVIQGLGKYWCHYGHAVYPEDGTDGASLFDFACGHLEQSLEDGKRADAHALARQRIA